MIWCGLTGGIGTGKSTVASMLKDMGYSIINADEIVHETLLPSGKAYHRVIETFGQEILDQDKNIDRIRLSKIVFNSPEQLSQLESIVHPLVRSRVEDFKLQQRNNHQKISFYDVPLLFEKKMESQFDKVIVVYCPKIDQVQRVMKRNGMSHEEVLKRIKAQIPIEIKKEKADILIDNSGSLKELKKQVEKMLNKIF